MITIYALVDPRTNQARYVGQTKNPENRLRDHVRTGAVKKPVPWIHELLKHDLKPEMIALEEGVTVGEWEDAEQFWISYLKALGADLVNIHKGGIMLVKKKEGQEMRLSDAQWRVLRKLSEIHPKGCEYLDIMKIHANGMTLQNLDSRGLIRMEKTFGTKFWYITVDGLKRVL